jgi:hypothetical protein
VIRVHAPDLIEEFQKIRSSQKNNATINYQSALGIPSRPTPLKLPRDYTSLTEAECSESNVETDKGSTSGKRTRDILTTQMESCKWSLPSNSDKRKRRDPKKVIPPSFHINSCMMENNENIPPPLTVEEIHNLDLSDIDPTPPTKIYDELVRVLGEAHRDPACNTSAGPSNR